MTLSWAWSNLKISRPNSNLILLPNSPQAASDMLNNMVTSFTASTQISEAMKKNRKKKPGTGSDNT